MDDHPLVRAAASLGESLLRPQAEAVDVAGVPRSHLDALAAAGLLGVTAPTDVGGSDCSLPVMRRIVAELAAADASTWFVWTQHQTPVRTLARAADGVARRRWLTPLATGAALAGVAFTHLRRPGPAQLSAQRVDGGWRVDGEIAWLTSWALADVFVVAAQSGDDVVWMAVPLRERAQVQAEPLALAAMAGTSTVRVRIEGLTVPDDEVVLVEPLAAWRAADTAHTADVSPAVFGVTRDAVRRLRERDGDARALAEVVEQRLAELREAADALSARAPGAALAERLRVRAQAHALACTATAGLVAAGGGRSMLLDQAAQRLARVALFLLVQGQTADVRAVTLAAFAADAQRQ